jgi:GPI mannosyltransferase 4
MILGFLIVLGTFNRVTFPAFILIPGMRLLPHFLNKYASVLKASTYIPNTSRPFSFLAISISGLFWTCIAVATDTGFYNGSAATASFFALFSYMRYAPIMTPLNNLRYNSQTSNLALHGLHPHYQHLLINIPQLLGPALIPLFHSTQPFSRRTFTAMLTNPRFSSAATGTLILSLVPHQEARFLLPCIPLLLTCIRIPVSTIWRRGFWISWAIFNIVLSVIFGIYHQGGVIPAQIEMPNLLTATPSTAEQAQVFWWKTYPPPTYLLGPNPINPQTQQPLNITTTPLMGLPQAELLQTLSSTVDTHTPACNASPSLLNLLGKPTFSDIYLAAPFSAWRWESSRLPSTSNYTFTLNSTTSTIALEFTHLRSFSKHINLDDMDFGDDGIVDTLARVVGRRGLAVWRVARACAGEIGHIGFKSTSS